MRNIDWMAIEKACAEANDLPDCVPSNAREWDVFIRQYERAVDLVEGRWHPHYDWETEAEFYKAVNEQFYLGRGYKKSIYECYADLRWPYMLASTISSFLPSFTENDWLNIKIARRFTTVNVNVGTSERFTAGAYHANVASGIKVLFLMPKKVPRNFSCDQSGLTSLAGSPEWVMGKFDCSKNKLLSLDGAPKRVDGTFVCSDNLLVSLSGAPEWIGGDLLGDGKNRIGSLRGLGHVGGRVRCTMSSMSDEDLYLDSQSCGFQISWVQRQRDGMIMCQKDGMIISAVKQRWPSLPL